MLTIPSGWLDPSIGEEGPGVRASGGGCACAGGSPTTAWGGASTVPVDTSDNIRMISICTAVSILYDNDTIA